MQNDAESNFKVDHSAPSTLALDLTDKSGWDRRYSKGGLRPPGTMTHTNAGNAQYYRVKFDALDRCLRTIKATLKGTRVLDAAGGTGQFVSYFLERQCRSVVIADYSEVALMAIQQRWRDEARVETCLADLTLFSEALLAAPFDFIFVQEAIFLIRDDDAWARALDHLSRYLLPGGHLIISDVFPSEREVTNSYVIRRSRGEFERILSRNSLDTLEYVRQSVLFNRQIFGRLQPIVERLGPTLYWMDRVARIIGLASPRDCNTQYLIAGKRNA